MTVRRLGPGDEAQAEALSRIFGPANEPADAKPFLASDQAVLFAADEEGEPAGWIYGHELIHPDGERTMLLYAVDVLERFQRRGHGRALVDAFVAEANRRNNSEVWVLTDHPNPPATALYISSGAKPDPVEAMYVWPLRPGPTTHERD